MKTTTRKPRRLWLRLTHPGVGYYWHCHKREKLPALDRPKETFERACWPGKGLTFGTACDIGIACARINKPGRYKVECGRYIITARFLRR